MAHTNQTPNYELSQFLGTDKPAWLVDYNGDMEKIDLGMKAAQDVADAAKAEADQGAIDIAAVTVTANSADAKANGAVSDIADAYDSTSTYDVGDYVIYNNILYKCIANITVPESFDGTHWSRTTVEEIITQITSDLTNIMHWNDISAAGLTDNGNTNFTPTKDGFVLVRAFKTQVSNYPCYIMSNAAGLPQWVLKEASETGSYSCLIPVKANYQYTIASFNIGSTGGYKLFYINN